MESLLLALLPIIGVIIGAFLQHLFNKGSNAEKQQTELKNAAYVDYLRSMAKSAHAISVDEQRSAIMDAANAKARIAVYGTPSVISALAKFEDAGAELKNEHSIDCFLELAQNMRNKKVLSNQDLFKILIGKNIKKKSQLGDGYSKG